MANSIPLSPKHGLNPTIPVCAWCGNPKNEIALMGRIKTDIRGEDPEAPRHTVLDYVPCDCCAEQWSKGVVVLEATKLRPTPYRPPIQKDSADGRDIYPTMRFVVVKLEAAERIFETEFAMGQRIMLEDKAFEQVFGESLKGAQS